jgi:hypothetical protein
MVLDVRYCSEHAEEVTAEARARERASQDALQRSLAEPDRDLHAVVKRFVEAPHAFGPMPIIAEIEKRLRARKQLFKATQYYYDVEPFGYGWYVRANGPKQVVDVRTVQDSSWDVMGEVGLAVGTDYRIYRARPLLDGTRCDDGAAG